MTKYPSLCGKFSLCIRKMNMWKTKFLFTTLPLTRVSVNRSAQTPGIKIRAGTPLSFLWLYVCPEVKHLTLTIYLSGTIQFWKSILNIRKTTEGEELGGWLAHQTSQWALQWRATDLPSKCTYKSWWLWANLPEGAKQEDEQVLRDGRHGGDQAMDQVTLLLCVL